MTIGVMDSGIGGLGVLAELVKRKCAENYVYFSDGENLPYGNKTKNELREIALRGVKILRERGANVLVFGCNTLSSAALDAARNAFVGPTFGLLPRPEFCLGKSLLLTTPTTALFLPKLSEDLSLLTPPDLAALIDGDYPDLTNVEAYLSPLLAPYADAESVYLGCSHYVFARSVFRKALPKAKILSGINALADLVKAVLPAANVKSQNVDFLFSGKNQTDRYAAILSSLL